MNITKNHAIREDGTVYNTKTGREISVRDTKAGYKIFDLTVNNHKTTYYLHRELAKAFVEGYFEGAVVDHVDGDKSNNNLNNLRWVTQRQNVRNWRNSGELYNIYERANGRYRVRITLNGKTQDFGTYDTVEEAIIARDKVFND